MSAVETDISVVVCTRDRPSSLSLMLESACDLAPPVGLTWELLVVDNGSLEPCAEVVAEFAGRLPVRRCVERTAGLSHARNRGVSEARGRYLCWTDDDVTLDAGWLAAYGAAFQRFPDAVVFGGRIIPALQPPTPDWFARHVHAWPLNSLVAHRDAGDEYVRISPGPEPAPYGANFAIRADAQARYAYDPELGLAPGRARLGEESDLIQRLLGDGGEGWWIPGSRVFHRIGPERQTWEHLHAYFAGAGETRAFLRSTGRADGPSPSRLRLIAALSAVGQSIAGPAGMTGLRLRSTARSAYYGAYAQAWARHLSGGGQGG